MALALGDIADEIESERRENEQSQLCVAAAALAQE
jgi:hypothetical protein